MTKRQMRAILKLVDEFKGRQVLIINKLEEQKNLELGRLDEEFDTELKKILVSKEE